MRQLFMQTMAGECGAGGGGDAVCTPQSTHSVRNVHIGNSEPGLPSSKSALEVEKLVFVQMPGGRVGSGGETGGLDVRGGNMGRTPPQSMM
jgi:hypothetical protein